MLMTRPLEQPAWKSGEPLFSERGHPPSKGNSMQKASVCEQLLIKQSQQGDSTALGELYRRHQHRVYSLALSLCHEASDAEDVLQEVFLRVYRSIVTFRGDAAFSTWLYRLTVNTTRSFLRKRATRPLPLELESELTVSQPDADPPARRLLLKALEKLSEGYREVLVLHDIQGLKHSEIAQILDIQPGTSKSQLSKARNRMRDLLAEMKR